MSSLDLISCGRVSPGQRVLERISKCRLDDAGIMSGISVGGILSFGVHLKMALPRAGWIHKCNPSWSRPPGPWRPRAECKVSPPFHRVSINGCWAPRRHQGCVSITDTCHRAIPLGETHHVALEITIPSSAPSPPACHLPNKTPYGSGEKKPRAVLSWGCWDLAGPGKHNAKIKSCLSKEIQLLKISLICEVDKTYLAFRTLCSNLVMLFCIIYSSVLSPLAMA